MKNMKVSLYRYGDLKKSLELEEKYDRYHDRTYEEMALTRGEMLEEDMAELRRKVSSFALSLGLSKLGEDYKNKEQIELDSVLWPDHPYKIGEFIDTVDDFGLSTVLGNLGLDTVHSIFSKQSNYVDMGAGITYVQPDWADAFDRVCDVLKDLHYQVHECGRNTLVSTVCLPVDYHSNPKLMASQPVKGPRDAIKMYEDQQRYSSARNLDKNYMNSFGWFYMRKALSIRAAIAGTKELDGRIIPCTYLIFHADMDWYRQALEIIRETIEYVLSDPKRLNSYWLKFDMNA
jgi:hypothetical protein